MDYPKLSKKEREKHIEELENQISRLRNECLYYRSEIDEVAHNKYMEKAKKYQGRFFCGKSRDSFRLGFNEEEWIYIYSVEANESGRIVAMTITVTSRCVFITQKYILEPELRRYWAVHPGESQWIINRDYHEIDVATFISKYNEVQKNINEHKNRLTEGLK